MPHGQVLQWSGTPNRWSCSIGLPSKNHDLKCWVTFHGQDLIGWWCVHSELFRKDGWYPTKRGALCEGHATPWVTSVAGSAFSGSKYCGKLGRSSWSVGLGLCDGAIGGSLGLPQDHWQLVVALNVSKCCFKKKRTIQWNLPVSFTTINYDDMAWTTSCSLHSHGDGCRNGANPVSTNCWLVMK